MIQLITYEVITKRKHNDAMVDNALNKNFNPLVLKKFWMENITYLKIDEGWMYLVIVMHLYSRRIIGWYMLFKINIALINR